jgi:replicative DNA helicase
MAGLPCAVESERALLGALLLEPIQVFGVVTREYGLFPVAFYDETNRLIAESIWSVALDRLYPIDCVTVAEEMRRVGTLEKVGGSKTLEKCIDLCPTVAHCEAYAGEIKHKWNLRRLVEAGMDIQAEAMKPEAAPEVVTWAQNRLMDMIPERVDRRSNEDVALEIVGKFRDAKAWRDGDETKKPMVGLTVPWRGLNETLCGLEIGLTVLAARPSAGKTTMEDMIALQVAGTGVPVLRVTLDSTKEELLMRALSRMSGCSLPKAKFGFGRMDQLQAMEDAAKTIGALPMRIVDDLTETTAICALAREAKLRHGIGLLTIDYAQIMKMSELGRGAENENYLFSRISQALKLLSYELKIPVLVLSQLSRAGGAVGTVPDLTHIRGSGSFEQDASKVVMLWRDDATAESWDNCYLANGGTERWSEKHRPVNCGVLKNKNGAKDRWKMILNGNYFYFEECGKDGFTPYGPKDKNGNLLLDGTGPAQEVTVPAGRGKGGKRQRDEEMEYFDRKR